MTNEEAIKEIQDASDYEVRHGDIEHHHEDIMRRVEAFEKAVNALHKEPVYFPPCVDCNTKMNEIREAHDRLKNQEPCEDIVSRKAVVELIEGWWLGHTKEDDLATEVKALPAVTPTRKVGKWIPVSERMPEGMGTYLVTLEYKEHGKGVTTLWYHGKGIGWDLRVADVVIAWMPLPEPYGEREGKDE